MRCLALRSHGYEVQMREFVSATATPKNVVIIASLTGKQNKRAQDELHRIEDLVGLESQVRRSLERRIHRRQEEDDVCRI